MIQSNNPYYLITLSPWPLILSLSIMNLFLSVINWMNIKNCMNLMLLNFFILLLIMFQWWRDLIRESLFQGLHSNMILVMMKMGMMMFIISEMFFFISFFWSYIHFSIVPSVDIGMFWPPLMISMVDPYNIPLLNSLILIFSGFSLTWSHYCLLNNKKYEMLVSLFMTILLGNYFSLIQLFEYYNCSFTLNDSVFGSIFFMATGFHGLHVLMGMIFILISLIRLYYNQMSSIHCFNFEAASWYWHFVDVIWLILYVMIYWWMK